MKSLLISSLCILCICVEISIPYEVSARKLKKIKEEVASYKDIAKSIIDLAVYGSAQNRSYERLALFVDTIGNRVSGSENLNNAIKYMYKALQEDKLQNVSLEPVKIPHWERGKESAMMIQPRKKNLAILGLGSSVGTPPEEFQHKRDSVYLHMKLKQYGGALLWHREIIQPYTSPEKHNT